jgi:hypothetical protein
MTLPNQPKLINAIDKDKMEGAVQARSVEELAIIQYGLNQLVNYWMRDPSEQRIQHLRDDFPILNDFIDFNIIFPVYRNWANLIVRTVSLAFISKLLCQNLLFSEILQESGWTLCQKALKKQTFGCCLSL